jgi:PadR family transcriptional regulator
MLGVFEQRILGSVVGLGNQAYAIDISRDLEEQSGKAVVRGALYRSLHRMEKKGLVEWEVEQGSGRRDGYVRRRFQLTEAGFQALRESRDTLRDLLSGVERALGRS